MATAVLDRVFFNAKLALMRYSLEEIVDGDISLAVEGVDLWHGTGAWREQSIRRHGLQTLDGSLFASNDLLTACCFAMARSKHEQQDMLLVGIRKRWGWETDATMRSSFKRAVDVPTRDIVEITRIERGTKLYSKVKELTELMALEIKVVK